MVVSAPPRQALSYGQGSTPEILTQQIFEQMALPALVINAQGCIVEVNDAFCQQLGYDRLSLQGQLFTSLLPFAQLSIGVQDHLAFFAHPPVRPTSRRNALLTQDQQILHAQILESKIESSPADFHRLLLITDCPSPPTPEPSSPKQETQQWLSQIEALNTQIAQLQDQLKLGESFLATVAHEIRSPLTTIKLAAQLIQACPSKQQDYIHVLEQECERGISLLSALLDLQSLTSPGTCQPELIPLQTWLPLLIEPFQFQAQAHHQQITLTLDPDLDVVEIDRKLLQRSLCQLLTNGIKYTPTQGQILIKADRDPNHAKQWQLQVSNSLAQPLPQTAVNHLFEPFYRVPQPQSPQTSNGLGLALVQGSVQAMGGQITVAATDHWIRFTLQLPLSSPARNKGGEF